MKKKKIRSKTQRVRVPDEEPSIAISNAGKVREQPGWDNLNNQEQNFIMAYMSSGSHIDAAKRIGMNNPQANGLKIMRRPAVRKYLNWWKDRVYETSEIDSMELLRQINNTVKRSFQDYVDQETGTVISDLRKLSHSASQQIDGVEQEVMELMDQGGNVVGRKIKTKFRLIGKAAAWKLAAEIAGLTERDQVKETILKTINWDEMYSKPKDVEGSEHDDIEMRIKAIENKSTTRKTRKQKVIK